MTPADIEKRALAVYEASGLENADDWSREFVAAIAAFGQEMLEEGRREGTFAAWNEAKRDSPHPKGPERDEE